MSIAITGASGALGCRTAELVVQELDPRRVVLATRDPSSTADLAVDVVHVGGRGPHRAPRARH